MSERSERSSSHQELPIKQELDLSVATNVTRKVLEMTFCQPLPEHIAAVLPSASSSALSNFSNFGFTENWEIEQELKKKELLDWDVYSLLDEQRYERTYTRY